MVPWSSAGMAGWPVRGATVVLNQVMKLAMSVLMRKDRRVAGLSGSVNQEPVKNQPPGKSRSLLNSRWCLADAVAA
jgi:hypothetical protein